MLTKPQSRTATDQEQSPDPCYLLHPALLLRKPEQVSSNPWSQSTLDAALFCSWTMSKSSSFKGTVKSHYCTECCCMAAPSDNTVQEAAVLKLFKLASIARSSQFHPQTYGIHLLMDCFFSYYDDGHKMFPTIGPVLCSQGRRVQHNARLVPKWWCVSTHSYFGGWCDHILPLKGFLR